MRLVLLVLLATSSAILSGNDYNSMQCLGVDRVYDSMKDGLRRHPMYHILKSRQEGICPRRQTNYYEFYNTCCDGDKEIALAISASSLFRRYIYSDSLQDFKYSLLDIISYYKGGAGAIFDKTSLNEAMEGSKNYTLFLNTVMKGQLQLTWKEWFSSQNKVIYIPRISDRCLAKAEHFQEVFRKYLDKFVSQLVQLIDGINKAINLIDALKDQKISPKCVEAVTRSSVLTIGCNQCLDNTAAYRPCSTYCANVVNGCMKPLLPIIPVWERWQAIMDTLDSNFTMEKQRLVALNLSSILHKGFRSDYIYLEQPENCYVERYQGNQNNTRRKSRNIERISESSGISERRNFYNLFHRTFDNIQFKFCRELGFAHTSDSHCWNGTDVGSYNRNLTMFNEESQEGNLEVQDSGFIYHKAQEALTQLKHFNQQFDTRLNGDTDYRQETPIIELLTQVPEPFNKTEPATSDSSMTRFQMCSCGSHLFLMTMILSLYSDSI